MTDCDHGGAIRDYLAHYLASGPAAIHGCCESACTLALGWPETCVSANARLGFYDATDRPCVDRSPRRSDAQHDLPIWPRGYSAWCEGLRMSDFLIDSTDLQTLIAAATTMGFYHAAKAGVAAGFIAQGPIPGDPDPHASFFLNVVGQHFEPTGATTTDAQGNVVPVMAAVPGFWVRLRLNGLNPVDRGLLTVPPTLTVYKLVTPGDGSASFWSSDGTTHAPAYLANIGVIA